MVAEVLVVEDDTFTRITLTSSLRSAGVSRVFAAATSTEAVSLAEKWMPTTALIDLHLGMGPTGLDVARHLRAMNPKIGIVILTSYDDPRLLGENPDFIPAGTRYLLKRDVSDIAVVMQALNSAPHSSRLLARMPKDSLGHNLSATQLSILKMVAEGHSNSEIARRRGVTEKAIEGTITRLATKLGLMKDSASNQRVHIARVYFRALGMNLGDDK
jgi:DNA-binding NarL/FixJ family response regulator